MKRMMMLWRLAALALGAAVVAQVPVACSIPDTPYDTTAVASKNCPKDQPAQCVAMFGDPRTAGIKASADPVGPAITMFAPTAYFGDAPFRADLAFQVDSPAGASLTCELDAEGDGIFEQHVDCSAGTITIVYPIPGRYAPALRVTDSSARVATASEILLSNRLIAKAATVLVDTLPGLATSGVEGDVVSLTFASESQVPPLTVGAMLFDRRVNGYVREVKTVTRTGKTLVAETEEHAVYDAFEAGYYGMRYAVAGNLDDSGAQPAPAPHPSGGPGSKPQDIPGEINLGPSTTKLSVPLPTTIKAEVAGVELALDNPALDIDFELVLFEASIPGRYAFIVANNKMRFESDASITGKIDLLKDSSIFLPIGPLGVGFSTPLGKAAIGAVIEVGVDADLNLSVGWHEKVDGKLTFDLRQTDPLAFDWIKKMLGYPEDEASVTGPVPAVEVSGGHAAVELNGKLFAAPQVVLGVGNASGVMQRAVKNSQKYKTECEQFHGIRAAAGFEASVSASAAIESTASGPALCLHLKRDAKFFAELFPGFEYCPSAEISILDDATKDWWSQCGPSTATCANGSMDGNETDKDCGGSCPGCAIGKKCNASSDCQSGKCTSSLCVALAANCSDGVMNGSETDKDCGGSCSPCATGKKCGGNADCQSGSCQSGVCVAVAPCPSGNGLYCGKQALGQNTSYLYQCQNGSYSLSSNCSGKGCTVSAPGVDDSCASCACAGGTCCSNPCSYDAPGTACGTCKVCDGAGGCNNASNGSACPGGACQNGVCSAICPCAGGTCCSNACNYDGSGTSCGTCKTCDGAGSCGNAANGTACPGGACQGGACSAACGAVNYWSPTPSSETDSSGTQANQTINTGVTVEVRESGVGLEVRACKVVGTFSSNVALSIYDAATNSTVGVAASSLATMGQQCSPWVGLPNSTGYAQGQQFGGDWQLVSPASSAGDWGWPYKGCSVNGSPTGTCWGGVNVTLTRTCKP